ncbi:uncharacterized protein LOC120355947, partial [Nilaparvata lugens]|uniref:uncharacterized protein LOC120355947 n=1 Tax=Nilaparvata lugens TaxID=108931 RepID=UPI00193C9064
RREDCTIAAITELVSSENRDLRRHVVACGHLLRFPIRFVPQFSLIIRPWQIFGKSSREFLTDFISLYESFPCIWRVKSKEYSDRNKKEGAYERLVEKFKEIDVNASRETVAKKINSLRSVYRKELAKVNKSIRSAAGEDEIYKPSLWYFDLLHFGPMNATNYWP